MQGPSWKPSALLGPRHPLRGIESSRMGRELTLPVPLIGGFTAPHSYLSSAILREPSGETSY